MATLAQAVISRSLAALRLIRQYLSNPSITFIPMTSAGVALPPQTVVMQATKFREVWTNQASKMLLVDVSKGKTFLNDNIAPMPTTWEIEGFLFPYIAVTPMVDQIGLEALKDTLRQAMTSRQQVQFKPVTTSIVSQFSDAFRSIANGSVTGTVPVVITSLEFELDPTVQNKAPFRMSIQKINVLSSYTAIGEVVTASPDGVPTNPAAAPSSNSQGNTTNETATTVNLPGGS